MIKHLLLPLLLATLPHFVQGQSSIEDRLSGSDAHARLTYWWLATPRTVHDSLAAQKCWKQASTGAVIPSLEKEKTEIFVNTDMSVMRFFTFYDGHLVRQSFMATPGTVDFSNMQEWFGRCYALPDGRRLDKEYGLILSRKYIDNDPMFILEPDWSDKEASKLVK